MKNLLKKYRRFFGPAFVAFEAVMHVYLLIYLSFHWTNWLVWGFTAFELSMFIFLLKDGKHSHGHPDLKKMCKGNPDECRGTQEPVKPWLEVLRQQKIAEGKICGDCGEWPEFCGSNCDCKGRCR